MSVISHEGWDHYGTGSASTTAMLSGVYAEALGAVPPVCAAPSWLAATGPLCLRVPAAASGSLLGMRRVLPSNEDVIFYAGRWSVPELPAIDDRVAFVDWRTDSNVAIARLVLKSTGAIELRNNAGTVLASTQGPVVVAENWHFLEMKFERSAGKFTLRIDDAQGTDTPAIAATGLSLGSSDVGQYVIVPRCSDMSDAMYVDDFIVRNDAGTANNDFMGDYRVATLFPNSDTLTAGWAPSYRKKIGMGILNNTTASDCVTAASSTSTDLGAGDYTIEQFVRFTALPTGSNKSQIIGKWDETNNHRSWQLYLGGPSLESGALVFRTSTDGQAGTVADKITWPWEPDLNVWYHLAVVRSSSELLLFIDGIQYGLPIADSATYYAGVEKLSLGCQVDGASAVSATTYFGYMDEVRLSIGYARYTSAFTPTTVAFGRNVTDDPHFATVALLCGFDSGIADESSYGRALTAMSDAAALTPDDGPDLGAYSAINQDAPRDDTFIAAALLPAVATLTLDANVAVNDTVTVGTTDGATPAVYTFKSSPSSAYQVLRDTTAILSLQNLYNAINAGAGAGTKYGTGTLANYNVEALQLPGDQMLVSAVVAGTGGNAIACSASLANGGSWDDTTLNGGADIPGPSAFHFEPPPRDATLIGSLSLVYRAYKSDAGTAKVQASFGGPLGAYDDGAERSMTTTPVYYADIFEEDPDTGDGLTPSTLLGGTIKFNRTE